MITDEPIEDLTFDFLQENIAAASSENVLFKQELHDTIFKNIDKNCLSGIRIGDSEGEFSLNAQDQAQEYDAVLTLVFFARIEGSDKTERRAARKKAFQIARAVAGLFLKDPKMNGRVCKTMVLTAARGWDVMNGHPYAVINMPVVFNPSGDINFDRRRTF